MGINMDKVPSHLVETVNLVKKVSLDKGLDPDGNPAAVVCACDNSPSNEMGKNKTYSSGLMSDVGDLAFAAAATFDDDGKMPFAYFNGRAHPLGDIELDESNGFINRTYRDTWSGGTSYMSALRWILGSVEEFKSIDLGRHGDPLEVKFTAPYPVFAMFFTDGEPTDSEREIEQFLIRMSQLPIFIQFVGVGDDCDFEFLNRLNKLKGRLIDNAGFFNAMTVMKKKRGLFGGGSSMSPEQRKQAILEGLLNEFPDFYKQARTLRPTPLIG